MLGTPRLGFWIIATFLALVTSSALAQHTSSTPQDKAQPASQNPAPAPGVQTDAPPPNQGSVDSKPTVQTDNPAPSLGTTDSKSPTQDAYPTDKATKPNSVNRDVRPKPALAYDFEKVNSEFSATTSTLQMVVAASPDGRTEEGYRVRDFTTTLDVVKTDLWRLTEGQERAPLRRYVETYFAPTSWTVQPVNTVEGPLIPSSRASRLFSSISDLLAKLENLNSLSVNLMVNTAPEGAHFLLASGGNDLRETTSNSEITNVFRGLYIYKIKKKGFKDVQASLNLVDESGTSLECTLVRRKNSEEPKPCILR